MKVEKLIRDYLHKGQVMQLTTSRNDQPWVCSVYFVADEDLNLYWLSWPERRHSQEIKDNPRSAIAIAIKTDRPVIGIQAEGEVARLDEFKTLQKVLPLYIEKYSEGQKFLENYEKGLNKHEVYKFVPEKFVLFDEVNFPDQGSRDWQL